MADVITLPDQVASFIKPSDYSLELSYSFSCCIGARYANKFLRNVCLIGSVPSEYSTFSVNTDTLVVSPITSFDTHDNADSQIVYHRCDMTITLPTMPPDTDHRYSFVLCTISDVSDDKYKYDSTHLTLFIYDHVFMRVYFMDPNGHTCVLSNKQNLTQHIDFALQHYFDSSGVWQYVPSDKWGSKLPLQFKSNYSWDKGCCASWCYLFAHWLTFASTGYENEITTIYNTIAKMPNSDRSQLIYNWIPCFYGYFITNKIISDEHIAKLCSQR
jgi:hypothetical protein